MAKYRCILIDDDPDRSAVASLAAQFPVLETIGIFESGEKALAAIEHQRPDILFLDIDKAGIGIGFRKKVMQVPVCIFVSAHAEHAIDTYLLDTLDFLTKPIRMERFAKTVARIEAHMTVREKATLFETIVNSNEIYIKEGHEKIKIRFEDIKYLEAFKDYTRIVTRDQDHSVLSSLGVLLKTPEFSSFIRIHRSYAILRKSIRKVMANEITLEDDTVLPVGRSYKNALRQLL